MLSLGHPRACGLFRGPRRRAAFERRVEGGAASHRRAWQRAVAQGVAGGAEAEAAGSAAQQASPSSSVSEPNGSTAAPPPPSDEQPSAAAAERQPPQPQPQQQPWLSPAALRKVSAAGDANEAVDLLLAELGGVAAAGLSEAHCRELLAACLERGNVPLAQSIYAAMTAAGSGAAASATASFDGGSWGGGAGFWPPATIDTATALVVGLAQALHTREAIGVINAVRSRGLRTAEDVHFGYVVACPGPAGAGKPLTVMQPQEGAKLVADAYSRWVGRAAVCSGRWGGLGAGLGRAVPSWPKRGRLLLWRPRGRAPEGGAHCSRAISCSAGSAAAQGRCGRHSPAPISHEQSPHVLLVPRRRLTQV